MRCFRHSLLFSRLTHTINIINMTPTSIRPYVLGNPVRVTTRSTSPWLSTARRRKSADKLWNLSACSTNKEMSCASRALQENSFHRLEQGDRIWFNNGTDTSESLSAEFELEPIGNVIANHEFSTSHHTSSHNVYFNHSTQYTIR